MAPKPRATMLRWVFGAVGAIAFALGFIGVFLPLLPTTPFMLLALACFARASPRVENWLLTHPKYGPPLRAWRERGAIGPKGKIAGTGGMATSYVIFYLVSTPSLLVAGVVAGIMVCVAIFILTRPS